MLSDEEQAKLTDALRLALAVRRPCDGLAMVARVMFIAVAQLMAERRATQRAP